MDSLESFAGLKRDPWYPKTSPKQLCNHSEISECQWNTFVSPCCASKSSEATTYARLLRRLGHEFAENWIGQVLRCKRPPMSDEFYCPECLKPNEIVAWQVSYGATTWGTWHFCIFVGCLISCSMMLKVWQLQAGFLTWDVSIQKSWYAWDSSFKHIEAVNILVTGWESTPKSNRETLDQKVGSYLMKV